MSGIEINHLLTQLRSMATQAQGGVEAAGTAPTQGVDFGALLKQSIDQVNNVQSNATNLAEQFQLGNADVDLTEVMVAMQKASVSFQAITQVRNKLVSAYQDIMNMPV